MTKQTYTIHAWCVRPFIACIDLEAATPKQAVALAKNQPDRLLDSAEECNQHYPWDEYAVADESGQELLRVMTDAAKVREAAHDLLTACRAALADYEEHIPSATTIPAMLRAAIAKTEERAA